MDGRIARLVETLTDEIAVDEGFASELSDILESLKDTGDPRTVKSMQAIVRGLRVRILEMTSLLAALDERHRPS